jgi:sigma-B regulation protein RsbU (phosphoserine phosphatase)
VTPPSAPARRGYLHWLGYGFVLALTLSAVVLYAANLIRWPTSPDFGWRTMYNSGPNIVAQVFGAGAAAGLRAGDRIVAINGRPYSTFDELFFGDVRHGEPGATNSYTVIRDGKRLDIEVPTGRVGLGAVLLRSGPLFGLGLVYILIGALVFLMKPRAAESWLFFTMTCFMGIGIGLSSPADLIRPTWLYDVRFLSNLLIPASMIHLALRFPKTRDMVVKRPWIVALPYVPSLVVFVLRQATATAHWSMPRSVFFLWIAYTIVGIVYFLGSNAWNALRDASIITRLQSRVIFVGAILAFFIPSMNLLSGHLWQVLLFPDPILGFGICFGFFPLSIGYTIIKHDLFAIDTIVRRTYGYLLSTASVVAVYAVLVSTLNMTFQGSDVARSPLFSIGFALAVVFLFEPLYRRFQSFVDRVFYRRRYDYGKTIRNISEAMTSILDADVIAKTLIGAVVREMFLENGALLLADPDRRRYRVKTLEGMDLRSLPASELADDDAVVGAMKVKRDALLRHDVLMNPQHEARREDLHRTFIAMSSELMLPLTYKDEMRGIISLGRKKSGKLFTPEDLDLLKTLTSQSAIALENAHLFRENLQKGRMEEELKIAHDIQMGMLPDKAPQLAGLTIAARTIPAREVGGDFYDFVELPAGASGARLGVIIGDVSGKGVSAGLLMAGARSTYRVLLDADPPVADVMIQANQRLHRDIRKGMFVALVYAVLDPKARTLAFSNAGQTQPILCQPGAEPSYVTTEGDTFPLGIVADCDYREATLGLPSGSVVVFYTDGAVEAMNAGEELYGFDRFLASVHDGRDLEPSAMLDKLLDDIARFVGDTEQHDDITIIVARVG